MILQLLITAIATSEPRAYKWAITLAVLQFAGALSEQQHQAQAWRMGRRARALCTALLYRKAAGLSSAAIAGRDAGDIANLVSNDADRLYLFSSQATTLWSSPAQMAGATRRLDSTA